MTISWENVGVEVVGAGAGNRIARCRAAPIKATTRAAARTVRHLGRSYARPWSAAACRRLFWSKPPDLPRRRQAAALQDHSFPFKAAASSSLETSRDGIIPAASAAANVTASEAAISHGRVERDRPAERLFVDHVDQDPGQDVAHGQAGGGRRRAEDARIRGRACGGPGATDMPRTRRRASSRLRSRISAASVLMMPRTATTMATREERVGDEEGLIEDLHHLAADLAVGDGEGVVLRAEHRFELAARGVAARCPASGR